MPTGGDVEVSAKEANEAVIVAPSTGDPEGGLPPLPLLSLEKIWDCPKVKVEKGPTVPKKVKPKIGDAATAVRYFILFLPHALHIILHKK